MQLFLKKFIFLVASFLYKVYLFSLHRYLNHPTITQQSPKNHLRIT